MLSFIRKRFYNLLYKLVSGLLCLLSFWESINTGPATQPPPPPPPQLFCVTKKKKRKQRKARKTFKAETIKRLSPRSKLYCLSHSRASRIQNFFWSANHGGQQYFTVFHGLSTLKSISPAPKQLLIKF